ncbi:MAG TPA: response regulator transcription factor [Terriglobales bacterium]|jgi:DNA-binding NarL/FixJ family response regulator|nr:response regulator transcription factor [Terriglobales bacterium]
MSNVPTRILIADDHPIFRDGLRRLLEAEPGFQVVGEAADGAEAVALVAQLKPDLLLLDLAMPRVPGMEALRELCIGKSPVRTILLTASVERPQIAEALQLGARGVVLKESATQVLLKSIAAVMAGSFWVGRESVPDLKELVLDKAAPEQPAERYGLTRREMQMVAAIVEGSSNREIALKFNVREDTVKHHLTSIFSKLGVSTRLELALFAIEHRLVSKGGASLGAGAPAESHSRM